jgi:MYXO-CTERM domain-containing protein
VTAAVRATRVRVRARRRQPWRLLLPIVLGALAVAGPFSAIVARSLSDAFLQVVVFVAWTLLIVVVVERRAGVDLASVMIRRPGLQYVIAAVLGGLPGCGGAVIVTTQFVRGQVTFGALLTVLVSTMGDAAFLLIARDPATAALVIGVCMAAGIVSGIVVDRVHGRDFLRMTRGAPPIGHACATPPGSRPVRAAWWLLVLGALPAALLLALQSPLAITIPGTDLDAVTALAVLGSLLSIGLWAVGEPCHHGEEDAGPDIAGLEPRVIGDTTLVATWVCVAFVLYNTLEAGLGLDFGGMGLLTSALAPALGVVVGLIPGCGPQILFTTLYLAGSIPLSAQLGNAISNDGDALFPALAVARAAAIRATVYSAVPALVVGYGWFVLFDA